MENVVVSIKIYKIVNINIKLKLNRYSPHYKMRIFKICSSYKIKCATRGYTLET
jgi:hypothetical protein